MSKIKNFLVCGGGMMGSAIAQILAGLDDAKVTVYDVFPVNVEAHDEDVFKENIEKYPQFETAIDQLHDSAPHYAGAL